VLCARDFYSRALISMSSTVPPLPPQVRAAGARPTTPAPAPRAALERPQRLLEVGTMTTERRRRHLTYIYTYNL